MLRRSTKLPVILDVECLLEGVHGYLATLSAGLRVVPDGLTVDLACENSLEAIASTKGFVKLIGIYHHSMPWQVFHEQEFSKLQAKSSKLSLHAFCVSAEAHSRDDNVECSYFLRTAARTSSIPVTAYNTGQLGRTSICFNPILSPVVKSVEDGVTIQQARAALYQSFVLEPLKFAILGSSVSYSLSPTVHNAACEACGMPHTYQVHQSDNFDDIHGLLDQNCSGLAISMPFKTRALSLLDFVSPEAQCIGAVNTVIVDRRDGTVLKGYNTDHIGIEQCFRNHLSPANSIRSSTTALIIGAGGMARAAVYAFQTMGVKNICVFNRTAQKAQELTEQYGSDACKLWPVALKDFWPALLEQPTMIVSTIPAHSINGCPHELNIPPEWLRSISGGTFVELAYEPLNTRLMEQMRQVRGWIVVDGLSVLLEQGVAQFELFTGAPAPIIVMRDALRRQFASASVSRSAFENPS